MELWNYSSTWDSFFQIRTRKMVPWIFIFFSKVYTVFGIWDWGLANFFWDHVIQFSIRQMNFLYRFPNHVKFNSFVETFTSYNEIIIFEVKLCMANIDFYIRYWPGPKINSITCLWNNSKNDHTFCCRFEMINTLHPSSPCQRTQATLVNSFASYSLSSFCLHWFCLC